MLPDDVTLTKTAAKPLRRKTATGRKASKDVRRRQLIDATIASLAERGFSETTLADVARGAGLSQGIVNFHFQSKDKLLVETLQFMAEEYSDHWRAAMETAGPDPARRLWALVAADFDLTICSKTKLAAWCAFWGEARSRPTYQSLCGARDEAYQMTLTVLCAELAAAAPPGGARQDAAAIALALDALLDGLWLRMMMQDRMTGERALAAARAFLIAVFPHQFSALTGHGVRPASR